MRQTGRALPALTRGVAGENRAARWGGYAGSTLFKDGVCLRVVYFSYELRG